MARHGIEYRNRSWRGHRYPGHRIASHDFQLHLVPSFPSGRLPDAVKSQGRAGEEGLYREGAEFNYRRHRKMKGKRVGSGNRKLESGCPFLL